MYKCFNLGLARGIETVFFKFKKLNNSIYTHCLYINTKLYGVGDCRFNLRLIATFPVKIPANTSIPFVMERRLLFMKGHSR